MSPVCPVLSPAFGGSKRGQKGQMPLGMSSCPFPAMELLGDVSGNLGNAGQWTGPSWICATGGRGAPAFSPQQNFWKSGSGIPKAVKPVKSGERAWKN